MRVWFLFVLRTLQHPLSKEDGVTDGLFRFSRPLTGAFYWCPALKGGKLDLSKLSID